MTTTDAYNNLETFKKPHGSKWISAMAPYKVLSCLDFANEYFFTTDIDCTQLSDNLSCWVIYEEKFNSHDEFKNQYKLQVQRRMLKLADKANVPAFLVFTSRKGSDGIICGNSETGIDWNKYLDTIATLYNSGDLNAAKEALGNGLADIYSKSNVIGIIPNETARKHLYKNQRIGRYLTSYETFNTVTTVENLNRVLKMEFPEL